MHVADLARAHVLALTAAAPGEHLICNLGNGNGFSVREVLATIEQVTGRPFRSPSVRAGPAIPPGWSPPPIARPSGSAGTPELTLADMIADAWEFLTPRGDDERATALFRRTYERESDGRLVCPRPGHLHDHALRHP